MSERITITDLADVRAGDEVTVKIAAGAWIGEAMEGASGTLWIMNRTILLRDSAGGEALTLQFVSATREAPALPTKPGMDELRDRIAQALSVPDVHHPDLCDCWPPVCGGTCDAEGEDCYCDTERCDGLEQQIDAVLTLLQPDRMERALRGVLEMHSPFHIYELEADGTPKCWNGDESVLATCCESCTPDDTIEAAGAGEWTEDMPYVPWPCPTVTTIQEVLR